MLVKRSPRVPAKNKRRGTWSRERRLGGGSLGLARSVNWESSGGGTQCFWHLLPKKTVQKTLSSKAEKVVKQTNGEWSHIRATERSYIRDGAVSTSATALD